MKSYCHLLLMLQKLPVTIEDNKRACRSSTPIQDAEQDTDTSDSRTVSLTIIRQ